MISLRPYQQEGIDGIRHSLRTGHRAPLYVCPTGGGKTVVFSYIAASVTKKAKRALILVHRVELLRQTSEKLAWAGVHHGMISPHFTPDASAPVQVASIQTLVKRMDRVDMNFDLIVIDEAHHATAGSWRKIIDACPSAYLLGVTATPLRGDGAGLGAVSGGVFDDLIVGPQIPELIAHGFLAPSIVYAPKKQLDLTGVRTRMGDFDKHEVELCVDKPSITGDVVDHYRRICPCAPAVAFCVSVAHAEHVADEFRSAGFRAAFVDGSKSDEERAEVLGGLANGKYHVVTSCDLISEGTDIPAITAGILLRPTKSTGLFIQQVGRVLRPSPGKKAAIILDHVGNVMRHGMPDEVRTWTLEGERKQGRNGKAEKTIPVKQCPQCFAVHRPMNVCPYCGYIHPVEQVREIDQVDGELVQITGTFMDAMKLANKREVGMAKTLDELFKIERARGYKRGWARHIWAARNRKQVNI